MDSFIIKLLVNSVAVFLTAHFLKGVSVKNFMTAILTALLIGLVNSIIKPIFVFLTIPITILTLGFFLFFIDAIMILVVDKMLLGFKVKNFTWAILFSILLAIINAILVWLL